MADPDAEVNGDTQLTKEVTKGVDAAEAMETEDADIVEKPDQTGDADTAEKSAELSAGEDMETEENGDVTDTAAAAAGVDETDGDAGVDETDAASAADGDKATDDATAPAKAESSAADGEKATTSDSAETKEKGDGGDGDDGGDAGDAGDGDDAEEEGGDSKDVKDAGDDEIAKAGDTSGSADTTADDTKTESVVGDATDADIKESANGDVSEDSASKPAPEKPSAATSETDAPSSAACTEPEESDSDIEEIEQTDPLSLDSPAAVAAAPSRDSPRLVVIDTDSLTVRAAAAAAAAPRPPPLTRAPPPQQSHHHQQQHHQQQQQHHAVTAVSINPAILQALAQYGINTSGMSAEHLTQLQDYYRRSHDDAEFVLEAPSFIVPYVMESPAEETVKQFMTRVTKEGDAAAAAVAKEAGEGKVNGEASKPAGEAESDDKSKKDGEGADKADKEQDSNKENKPDAGRKEEDFSHLGKWAYYYQAPVGQLLLDQGRGIVEEFIKEDLLKQQKRKASREKGGGTEATRFAIKSLSANLAASRRKNAPFRLKMTQCRYCAFETESVLVMERHLEMPHMVGSIYQCNFCDYETRSPQVVLSHMMEEHSVQGRLERAPASFQCPLCPYEDSGKARMTRHLNSCQKKFRIEKNQSLDDWVPPAKVPKIHRGRPNVLGKQFEPVRGIQPGTKMSLQQQQQQQQQQQLQQQQALATAAAAAAAQARGRGRPVGSYKDGMHLSLQQRHQYNRQGYVSSVAGLSPSMIRSPASGQMLMPPHYQIGNQIYQLVNNQLVPVNSSSRAGGSGGSSGVQIIPSSGPPAPSGLSIQATSTSKTVAAAALKLSSTPSISITPVPRPSLPPSVPSILRSSATSGSQLSITKGTVGGGRPDAAALSKGAFVICEICDGYIKDLEQLRNHMQWIHKVKIHPKMIYNRPPLNCQKCQLRFFTDQGLERHLLGSHGLVTSSMQEAANKGHDSGRCPICGKVYQWKLLHHVSKDHHVTLKPAHLSYKCTVCTATFSMYKQFENHVYSSHSVVAKKIMESSDRKKAAAAAAATGQPIKINDEITIIPHPGSGSSAARAAGAGAAPSGAPQAASTPVKRRRPEPPPAPVERECEVCDHRALPLALTEHYRRCHLGRPEVEFTPLQRDPECAEFVTDAVRQQLRDRAAAAADSDSDIEVEVSDPEDEAANKSGGGGALSKLNKEITITPITAARPRRVVTVRRSKPFMGPASARRRRRARLAPRSVAERRQADREAAARRRNPSVVELSDSESAAADNTVDLEAEEDENEDDDEVEEVKEVKEVTDEKVEEVTDEKIEEVTDEKIEEVSDEKIEEVTDDKMEEVTEEKEEEVEEVMGGKVDEVTEDKMEEEVEEVEEVTEDKMEEEEADEESGSAGGSGEE